nr:replication initiation protein [Microvirus sp.]
MQYFIKPWPKGVNSTADLGYDGAVQIPCGRCIGCRLEYSRQWANRCLLELQYHDSAYFVTLTYNDEAVPRRIYSDEKTGEVHEAMSLQKKDFQLFMKRLRRRFSDDKIRFFAAGEYGGNTFRPHYHAILFGLHLDDLQLYKPSKDGFNYYTSEKLQKVWDTSCFSGRICYSECKGSTTPLTSRGFVVVANVSWDTCAYVARYVTKKLVGFDGEFYDQHNIEKPFSLMSRKPGIGRQYYDEHEDLYDYTYINVATEDGGKKFRPPKYFDRLKSLDDPEAFEQMKVERRFFAEASQAAKAAQTQLSFLDALQVSEDIKSDKTKALRRNKIE